MSVGCLLQTARRTPERISEVDEIIKAVQDYGITTVMAVGMGYFIFFIWQYVTQQILPSLEKTTITTIALIDRIRMLDNDMIRMDQKINTILELRDIEKEKKGDR
jgi:hypothetical protein|tara:strand:- start:224 stop:538 length:315 start_codon:yes stop_codon:yes gene_type:complete